MYRVKTYKTLLLVVCCILAPLCLLGLVGCGTPSNNDEVAQESTINTEPGTSEVTTPAVEERTLDSNTLTVSASIKREELQAQANALSTLANATTTLSEPTSEKSRPRNAA